MTGLEYPSISPIIFSIGPIAVRWYSMAYLVGILVGWWLINRNVRINSSYRTIFSKNLLLRLNSWLYYSGISVEKRICLYVDKVKMTRKKLFIKDRKERENREKREALPQEKGVQNVLGLSYPHSKKDQLIY